MSFGLFHGGVEASPNNRLQPTFLPPATDGAVLEMLAGGRNAKDASTIVAICALITSVVYYSPRQCTSADALEITTDDPLNPSHLCYSPTSRIG